MAVTKTKLKDAAGQVAEHKAKTEQEQKIIKTVDRMVECKAILDEMKDIQTEFDDGKKYLAALASGPEHDPEKPVTFEGTHGRVGFSKCPISRVPVSEKYKDIINKIGLDAFLSIVDLSVTKMTKNLSALEQAHVEELGGIASVYGSRRCNTVEKI